MRLLRTISTRRLLAVLAGAVAAIAAGTAIAIAAAGDGPVPPPKPLALALREALAAPAVPGISARITWTNRLIDSIDIQGSDPLLTGGSGRLWLSPRYGLRIEIQSDNGDAQIVVAHGMLWASDPTANTVFELRLPAGPGAAVAHGDSAGADALPSVAQIETALTSLAAHVAVSGAIPGDVAGRPVYTVRVAPKTGGGLLGGAELAWDAVRGVPLRFALYARGDSSPVLELAATDVSYGKVSRSVFAISPPSGAHVVSLDVPLGAGALARMHAAQVARTGAARRRGGRHARSGASHVTWRFALDAPATLAGMTRTSLTPLGGGKAAVIAYGEGLGGVYVIERSTGARSSALPQPSSGGYQLGLHLPTVTVNGAAAQELDTALGSVLTFTRAGVSYTVLGSVTPATVQRAARSL